MACRQCAGVYRGGVKVKMSTEKFEPYGEPLPEFRSGNREHPRATSAILNAVGPYTFWFLVAVIVFTRIAFFSPVPAFSNQASSNQVSSGHAVLALTDSAQR
jgi:hypothetical protein